MWTYRLIYICALAGSILFRILYPYWFSLYFMNLVLLLIPFDFLISLPGMLTGRISLAAPRILEYGAEGTLTLTTIRKRRLPAGRIKVNLQITNDDYSTRRSILCDAESNSLYKIAVDATRSGATFYQFKRIIATSIFGLFSVPVIIDRRISVLVLPAPVKPSNIISLPRGVILRPKPGGGFSEDHELRPYRPGDPIRNIHWKISAKHDSIIIREPLIPPAHSRLVNVMKWKNVHERDLILGRLRWISDYLLKWELPYYIKHGEDGTVAEITNTGALFEYLYCALSGIEQSFPLPSSLPVRFMWVFRVDAK